jgi:hypothetical protein
MRQQHRQVGACRLVLITATRPGTHIRASRQLSNDLRTLRNLLQRRQPATETEREPLIGEHTDA